MAVLPRWPRRVKRVHAGQRRLRLPGRRRPGLHRHGRDGTCRHARREHHRHLHQQRHLRHDRRPDGPHEPAATRSRRPPPTAATLSQRRLPRARLRDARHARRRRRIWSASPWIRRQDVRKAKKAIKKAFQNQVDGVGYSLVEVVSTCPTNWGMTPQDAFDVDAREHAAVLPARACTSDVLAEGFANVAEAARERAQGLPHRQPDRRRREVQHDDHQEIVASSPASAAKASLFAGKVIAYAGLDGGPRGFVAALATAPRCAAAPRTARVTLVRRAHRLAARSRSPTRSSP